MREAMGWACPASVLDLAGIATEPWPKEYH
jgi:hypothetical protein